MATLLTRKNLLSIDILEQEAKVVSYTVRRHALVR